MLYTIKIMDIRFLEFNMKNGDYLLISFNLSLSKNKYHNRLCFEFNKIIKSTSVLKYYHMKKKLYQF